MKKITVAVVGLSFGMEFVPIYREHPGVNKVYVCDFSKDLLETAKMRYDIPEECCTEEFESLLSNPEIDAIHIVTTRNTRRLFSQSLERGKTLRVYHPNGNDNGRTICCYACQESQWEELHVHGDHNIPEGDSFYKRKA